MRRSGFRVLRSLSSRLRRRGRTPRSLAQPGMVWAYDRAMADSRSSILIPAFASIAGGWFTMGTELGFEDERPPHSVFVDRFELGVCAVTRAEYERFVDATNHELPRDWSHPAFAQADLPVVGVD